MDRGQNLPTTVPSAEDEDTWLATVSGHAVHRGGVARPSGGWGDGGQGVREHWRVWTGLAGTAHEGCTPRHDLLGHRRVG
jgi:hypothetical protein